MPFKQMFSETEALKILTNSIGFMETANFSKKMQYFATLSREPSSPSSRRDFCQLTSNSNDVSPRHKLVYNHLHHDHLDLQDEEKLEEGVGIAGGGQGAGICQTRVWNINSTNQCLDTNISNYRI